MPRMPTTRTVSFKQAPAPAGDPLRWRDEGVRLWAAGDRAGAGRAFLRYLQQPPTHPAIRQAEALRQRGRLAEADGVLRPYLATTPNDPLALRLLAFVSLMSGHAAGAEALLRKVLELAPGFTPARAELAAALFQQGLLAPALAEVDRLLAAEPKHGPGRMLRAQILLRSGDSAGADRIHAELVAEKRDDPRLWLAHGQSLRALRRPDEAVAAFRRAITLREGFGEAWWNLANLKSDALDAADRARLEALIAAADPKGEDGYHLRFAHARALEDAGEWAAAMAAYRSANAERRALLPPADAGMVGAHVRRSRAVFTPALLAARRDAGDPSPAPIFILGLPRSGSTLLEQILACHPQIEGTQELPDILVMVAGLDGAGKAAGGYPEMLATLPPERLRALGRQYVQGVDAKRAGGRPFFTDKQPANWMHVGLIRMILPQARIIDMRRDAFSCCLSMYRQHFAKGAAYSYAIDTLAERYRHYVELMDHWHAVMPGAILPVSHAGLVDDPEGTIRRVLDHLGLPFAAECLAFHQSDRPVFTPSSEQVRRPINRDGEVRIAGLAPHAEDLRAALAGLA